MRRLISTFLVICTMVGMCSMNAAAVSQSNKTVEDDVLQKNINSEYEAAMECIYAQLKAQDALDMLDVYEDIIYTMIVQREYAEAGIEPFGYTTKIRASNGGTAAYAKPREFGTSAVPVVIQYMTPNQFDYDLIAQLPDLTLGGLVMDITKGRLPKFAALVDKCSLPLKVFDVMYNLLVKVNSTVESSVKNANGYAMIINTYRYTDSSWETGILGWSTHPHIYLPDDVPESEVEFEPF